MNWRHSDYQPLGFCYCYARSQLPLPYTRLLDQEVHRGVVPVGKARPFRERALFLFSA